MTRAVLWAENSDLTAILRSLFGLAEIGLDVVATEAELLREARASPAPDFLVIDCSCALADDMRRCISVVTHTALPIHIVHPRPDIVDDLRPSATSRWPNIPRRSTWLAASGP